MKRAVVHCKGADPWDVYVGRPSRFGNPWSHKSGTLAKFRTKTVKEAVDNFEIWLDGTGHKDVLQEERQWILDHLHELVGKTLACWCEWENPCHGKILAERAKSFWESRDNQVPPPDSLLGRDGLAGQPQPEL